MSLMEIIKTRVLKTEKQEVIEENGEITQYTLLYLPASDDNRRLLYSEDVLIISHTQREGSELTMELDGDA